MTLQEYKQLISKGAHTREALPKMPSRPVRPVSNRVDNWEGELPYPPSVNHYWRTAKGHTFISQEGKQYREAVIWRLKGQPVIEGRVKVLVKVYPPDHRKRDLDNINKALLDAIKHGGILIDDSQIKDLHLVMMDNVPIVPLGKVFVSISRITGGELF